MNKISGQIVDVVSSRIFRGTIFIDNGKIIDIIEDDNDNSQIIMPGFVDSHVHVESSLLIPTEFARLVVPHGSVASVSDPHEIANVLGVDGVRYMIEVGKKSPFKFYFGAPSCVPATTFETAGATLNSDDIEELLSSDDIKYLGEMMNYPGVLFNDDEVSKKLEAARRHAKAVDGHAPLLKGDDLKKYCAAGISTDHECSSIEEAKEKILNGMKIQIREGSAANNFDALIDIIRDYPEKVMLCTDDAHPHELIKGHINMLVKKAIDMGYDIIDVIKAATINPVRHYNLEVGMLQKNEPADFIVIDNFKDFNILKTYIDGILVAENEKSLLESVPVDTINNFVAEKVTADDFTVVDEDRDINIIGVVKGELLTEKLVGRAKSVKSTSRRVAESPSSLVETNLLVSDVENDILKIAVINRYEKKKPAVAFIKGFGLKKGALASSVAHDSHNVIVIGCDDESMAMAANMIIENKGGFAVYADDVKMCLPLPVAGIMTNEDAFKVAADYQRLKDLSKTLGSTLSDPFMTMEFMALLVIPKLKLSDKGLFDCEKFELISMYN
ncbi:MAG: adenine deaminase [Bacteroidales bacterium]|nr:adenine deaminase [Bacteroidales bacterium]